MKPEAAISNALADWLAHTHPHDNPRGLFSFMVPNERGSGSTRQREIAAGQLMKMGLRPGVADWVFVWRDRVPPHHHGTCIGFIELKAGKNKQTASQRLFQEQAEAFGLKYAVCRSLEECVETLREWGATS